VGKINRRDGKDYLSANIITIDTRRNNLTGRLLALPVGGGLQLIEDERGHQIGVRNNLFAHNNDH
jgi:hypothetical protein